MPVALAVWLLAAQSSATLVIYRDYAEPLLFAPAISVDGHEIGRLGEKRYLAVELSPGKHRIEALWPKVAGHQPTAVSVTLAAGSEGYVRLTGTAGFWRTKGRTALVEKAPAEGAAEASACCRPAL